VFLKDPSDNLGVSSLEIKENGGKLTFVDMPISSAPIGSEQSYSMKIDGSSAIKVWGMGNTTSLSETAVAVEAGYLCLGDPCTNGSWRFVVLTNGTLSVQKRISGSWVEKGNFSE